MRDYSDKFMDEDEELFTAMEKELMTILDSNLERRRDLGYLDGILDSAAIMGGWRSPSIVANVIFNADSYIQELAAYTKSEAPLETIRSEETLSQAMAGLMETNGCAEGTGARLSALIEDRFGKCSGIFRFSDFDNVREAASGYADGWGPFYYMEDLFIATFEKIAILFMLGNDE